MLLMIYHSEMISKSDAVKQLGSLFIRGGEAALSDQYSKSWAIAASLRSKNPTFTQDQLIKTATNSYLVQVSAAGAASGAVAAAPFFGFLSTLGSAAADLYFFGKVSVNHILLIAALHDLQLEDIELRRLTVLSSFLGEPNELSRTTDVTDNFIANLNNKLAQRVIIKVGSKLLPVRAGAALPLFIGAAAAASLNAKLAQQISANAVTAIKLQAT